ncbi:MAG TPA: hypothetical protein VHG72_09070, partial [Polyangia bacterium]|nr:hypothetical protein [Polyangia bacterium]
LTSGQPGSDATGGTVEISGTGGTGCPNYVDTPPVLTVVDANTGLAICDPTVTMQSASLDGVDGGMFIDAMRTPCGPAISTCPQADPEDNPAPTDAAASPCVYALEALNGDPSPTTIEVSKPGYVSASFFDISGGVIMCGAVASSATRSVVTLVPVAADAAADGL